jgi:lysophospholipase L1-like esterase
MNFPLNPRKLLSLVVFCFAGTLFISPAFADPVTTIPVENPIPPQHGWDKECTDRIAAAQGKPIDIIFIGDSITQNFVEYPKDGWNLVGGTVWNADYAKKNALNLGVGSDGTEHILYRMDHSDIKSFTPKVVVLLCGVNDMQYSADDIAAGVKAVVAKIQVFYPQAKVVVMHILPNGRSMEKTAAANQIIDTFVDNKAVFSLDLTPEMTPEGNGWKGIGGDRVHLTEEGYKIWTSQLDPLLDKLLELL